MTCSSMLHAVQSSAMQRILHLQEVRAGGAACTMQQRAIHNSD